MWLLFFIFFFAAAIGCVVYLITRVHRFTVIARLAEKHRVLSWFASAAAVASIGLFAFINVWTVIVVLLHLAAAWGICDFAAFIVRKASKRDIGYDIQGAAAILICAVYLGVGWYNAHHVSVTEYKFETEKDIGDGIRIVEIADAHLGMTLDGEGFARQMERLNEYGPDAVVIVGDFVDDDSKLEDLVRACRALGELETKYGVYFVYGNHDDGYYRSRDFDPARLRAQLVSSGVRILEDESVLVDDLFYIIGRKDRSAGNREGASALTAELDREKYMIMLDHQPNDYDAESESGADLVLSGHTHGGHMFPAGYIGLAMGSNDLVYGTQTTGATNFVVTSGISGWAIPFKTGTFSEFVVIDVAGRR